MRIRMALKGTLCVSLLTTFSNGFVLADDVVKPANVRFAKKDTRDVPDFQKHVVPLLGRLGCNSAKCHGSFQGQGDFRLSLFGFNFNDDLQALTAEASSEESNRLTTKLPLESLILKKPTMQIDHEGGQRFEKNSWEYRLLLRWIESGANGAKTQQTLSRLEVQPSEIVFQQKNEKKQIKVIAVWQNGSKEDVTCLCRFRSNDNAVVLVDQDGVAQATGKGDTHVIAFYDNGVAAIPILFPMSKARSPRKFPNLIDGFVDVKLAKLGITASQRCFDTEFLRRVSIDMTGTLPTPEEIESFLAEGTKDKRLRKIDELLNRPAYAAWWANKLCDFTGCSPTAITNVTEVGQAMSAQWYDWIFKRIANDTPYDKLVEGIVLSVSRLPGQSRIDYAVEMSAYVRRKSPTDFSKRKTMPHYWTRQTVREPKEKALAFAHSFLGIQLQCAQCHKHPFDQWTQKDFNDFASFFENVRTTKGLVGFPQFAAARAGEVIGWPELYIDDANEKTLRLLRTQIVTIPQNGDPRVSIMKWMRKKNNPWFARAFVNRVWASYFHVGIVDPPDAFTPANPASHPKLLEWLTQGFLESNYDMKWLHRQIASSETYQRSWKPNKTNRYDRRNFSRAIPRRIPAEVMYDAVKQVTAATDKLHEVRNNLKRRASGHLSMRMAGTYAMNVFGKPERSLNCDCERVNEPTLLQAIFLQNDPLIRMRLSNSGWIASIADAEKNKKPIDHSKLIRTAWLRTVNRPPTTAEVTRAKKHLAIASSQAEGIRELLWALINTKEFVLNH